MIRRRLAAVALAAAAVGLCGADAAHAAAPPGPLLRGLSDGGLFANRDATLRAGAGRVAGRAQVQVVRVPIAWSTLLDRRGFTRPGERRLPLSDPAHHTYDWSRIDTAVREISAGGFQALAYFMSAPKWAESSPRYRYAPAGTWAPRPRDLAVFASAVARRYDGTYPDPLAPGRTLPRIARFQTWNEPNLGRFLQPQWVPSERGRPKLFAARWYREMHRAAAAAIRARQPDAVVGLAGLPAGRPAYDGEGRIAPVRFLRSLLCVGGERPPSCGEPLPVDAVSLHPLTVGDPDLAAETADDLSVADVESKLAAVLREVRAAGGLAGRADPELWITEMNWLGDGPYSVPPRLQGLVVGRAIRRFWQAGATIVNWQFAVDPLRSRTSGRYRPGGLVHRRRGSVGLPGTPKPFLAGFTVPTVVIPSRSGPAYVWVLVPGDASTADIQVRSGGRWRTRTTLGATGGVAEGFVAIRRGAIVRAVTAGATGAAIPVRLRSGLPRWGAGTSGGEAARAARAAGSEPVSPPDPRAPDPEGPGFFSSRPPLLDLGMPPRLIGPGHLVRAPQRPTGPLRFDRARRMGVVLGSAGDDRFAGDASWFFGFGGRDRRLPGATGELLH